MKSIYKYGINNNTFELLYKNFEKLTPEEGNSVENLIAFLTIDCFTRYDKVTLLVKIRNYLNKLRRLDVSKVHYDEETDRYKYIDGELVIPFNMITRLCKTDDKVIKELLSKDRAGYCHSSIMSIAPNVPNSRVVTGYVVYGNNKYLHTVLEYNVGDKEVILDWTRNIVMEKKDYCKLTKFQDVTRFDGELVGNDIDVLKGLGIDSKTYCTFRNEIMNDINKNKSIYR